MNMNMCWYGVDGGGCGGCGWCVCPPVCLPRRTPTTFEPVEKSVDESVEKICLRTPTYMLRWMGRSCAKFGYLEWAGHVKNKKTMGQGRGPKKRRRRHFVLSLICCDGTDMTMCMYMTYITVCCCFMRAGEYIGRDRG